MFCRSFFVLLYFFVWPLYCLFFYDIRNLIDYPFGIVWPLCCLFFYDTRNLIDYPLGIVWPLCCMFFYDIRNLIDYPFGIFILFCYNSAADPDIHLFLGLVLSLHVETTCTILLRGGDWGP
jgi:hypothetical protein